MCRRRDRGRAGSRAQSDNEVAELRDGLRPPAASAHRLAVIRRVGVVSLAGRLTTDELEELVDAARGATPGPTSTGGASSDAGADEDQDAAG